MKSRLVLISALIVLTISGCCGSGKCNSNTEISNPAITNDVIKDKPLLVPKWFNKLPGKKYSVGISLKSYDRDTMKKAAKQMAAVMHSRSKSAYSIRKFAQTTSDSFFMTNSADFHLDVSTNPEQIQSIYDSFTLVDSFFINDNFIGLYSSSKSKANRKLEKSIKPDWTKNPPIVVKNGKARSAASSTSATLQGAYESAVQHARKQILSYYFTTVSSYIENIDDSLLNELAVESSYKLVSTPITRCYVEPLFNDGMYSYLVYIEMETNQYK